VKISDTYNVLWTNSIIFPLPPYPLKDDDWSKNALLVNVQIYSTSLLLLLLRVTLLFKSIKVSDNYSVGFQTLIPVLSFIIPSFPVSESFYPGVPFIFDHLVQYLSFIEDLI
jgi:hypothetical protein